MKDIQYAIDYLKRIFGSIKRKQSKYPACQRCGTCCLYTLCHMGDWGSDGVCRYLKPIDPFGKQTLCEKIVGGSKSLFTGGCTIKPAIDVVADVGVMAERRVALIKRFKVVV